MTEWSLSYMKNITQNMRYLQSLMGYAQRYEVSAASRKYNRSRSFIYSGESDGTGARNRCSACPEGPTPIPISTRKKN